MTPSHEQALGLAKLRHKISDLEDNIVAVEGLAKTLYATVGGALFSSEASAMMVWLSDRADELAEKLRAEFNEVYELSRALPNAVAQEELAEARQGMSAPNARSKRR